MDTIDWLLDSDPALRFQVMRDLTNASSETLAAERARIPHEGLGAEILAGQGSDGPWHREGPATRTSLGTLWQDLRYTFRGHPAEPWVCHDPGGGRAEVLEACWCCAPSGETCTPSNNSGLGQALLVRCFPCVAERSSQEPLGVGYHSQRKKSCPYQ